MTPKCEGIEDTATATPVNIAVLGASSVGKTALTLQFITGVKVESDSCQPTIETSFFKKLHFNDTCSIGTDFRRRQQENGAECLWKTDACILRAQNESSTDERRASESKRKSKCNNNRFSVAQEMTATLKITDTASYKPTYNSRKSLRERLAKKLTPRRRPPVNNSDAKVRKRYLHVLQDSHNQMNSVPSFIYRQPNASSGIGLHANVLATADAFVLVYNVRDRRSFDALIKIRNEIRLARGCDCTYNEGTKSKRQNGEPGRKGSGSKGPRSNCICASNALPFIAVVGTHLDLTDSGRCRNPNESSNPPDDASNSRKHRKRIPLQAQVSFAVDILSRTHLSEVSAGHVEGVIGTWEECVGYAEISNNSVDRVRRMFEHLTLEVIRNRAKGPVRGSMSSARSRFDSVISVFSRKSVSGLEDDEYENRSGSCLCFC